MSVVVVSDETETEPEETAEEVGNAVEALEEAVSDAVMDSTTIALVERVTRIEDAVAALTVVVDGIVQSVQELNSRQEVLQMQEDSTSQAVEEIAVEAADAVQEVAQEIDEASPEITPDELPATREHPFFRKWGRKS